MKHHKHKKLRKGPDNSVTKIWDSGKNQQKSRRCDECDQSVPSNQQQFLSIGQDMAGIQRRNISILNPGVFVPPPPPFNLFVPPFINIPIGHIYPRTPFNTSEQVRLFQGCHGFGTQGTGGARDIGFFGIQVGEAVFAVEPGTVVFVRRDAICFSQTDPNDPNRVRLIDRNNPNREIPASDCFANQIVVRGSDGAYTEYSHVFPSNNLVKGSPVQAGDFLGNVDLSGPTSGPHVHFARYDLNFFIINPTQERRDRLWFSLPTCDWSMLDKGNLVTVVQV